ncbi:Equilibrative nucleoside transporter [Macleaya cordata]|uniref:Equilibrative nucleoside transporter n=1 Tax=Macleaya cordata TaxID=56857 RepID=A0A200Q7V8_MACCD|nr:Equilibrative nucleoside transporter [Macleaya cordata]
METGGKQHLGDDDDQIFEPRDTYNIAYIIHFILGLGNLLPWNALITAVDYFGYRYPTEHIDKVFAIAYMGSSLPVLVLLMSWGSWCKKPSFRFRMNLGLSMFVLTLMTPSIMDWTGCCSYGSYSVIVAAVAVCGLADGLIGGSLIGSAGELPQRYMQAVFAGTASSGVLVSILRIITKASLPQTPKGLQTSAHLYFLVSTLIMLGCIICCNLLHRLPVIQYYMHKRKLSFTSTSTIIGEPIKFWQVAKRIRFSAFGILLIYIVTLSIFPGFITENLVSNTLKDWYPILLITVYNVSDLVGKSLTSVYVPKSTGRAGLACIGRLLFYPLFTACLHGPRWFRSEVPVIFLTSLLGLSNGFLTSVLMILAPKSVVMVEAEMAGIVMALFLGIGLVGGSVLGWFWII